jgi:hypothetical protein
VALEFVSIFCMIVEDSLTARLRGTRPQVSEMLNREERLEETSLRREMRSSVVVVHVSDRESVLTGDERDGDR